MYMYIIRRRYKSFPSTSFKGTSLVVPDDAYHFFGDLFDLGKQQTNGRFNTYEVDFMADKFGRNDGDSFWGSAAKETDEYQLTVQNPSLLRFASDDRRDYYRENPNMINIMGGGGALGGMGGDIAKHMENDRSGNVLNKFFDAEKKKLREGGASVKVGGGHAVAPRGPAALGAKIRPKKT